MTDERLELAIPDDQVCPLCQAVVLDTSTHREWHEGLMSHVNQRISGVERRTKANAQQAMDLIGIEQRDREHDVEMQSARITGLNESFVNDREDQNGRMASIENSMTGMFARLRGVEDELARRENAEAERIIHGATKPPSFVQEVATCGQCYWSKDELTLCGPHTFVIKAAREEMHAQ